VSITVEYYFSSPRTMPDLADELNGALACELKPFAGDETDYLTRVLGMEFHLEPHEDENDGDLEFAVYDHSVRIRTSGSAGHCRPIQLPAMMSVAHLMQHRLGYAGMLVFNLGVLLAKYEPVTFVDTLSGTSLNDFPAHLAAVTSRLPPGHGLTYHRRIT
jgi:hypothetical protein